MKTTGLTLQEALQALVAGKAKRAVHPFATETFLYYNDSKHCFAWQYYHSSATATFIKEHLTPEWSLIGPVQEYEEVEVVGWAVVKEDGTFVGVWGSAENAEVSYSAKSNQGSRIIKMTGIDCVPKKEKVTRRVEVDVTVDQDGEPYGKSITVPFTRHPETHGKNGKLIFEWEE